MPSWPLTRTSRLYLWTSRLSDCCSDFQLNVCFRFVHFCSEVSFWSHVKYSTVAYPYSVTNIDWIPQPIAFQHHVVAGCNAVGLLFYHTRQTTCTCTRYRANRGDSRITTQITRTLPNPLSGEGAELSPGTAAISRRQSIKPQVEVCQVDELSTCRRLRSVPPLPLRPLTSRLNI